MLLEKLKEPLNLYPGILSEDQAKTVVKMYTNTKRCPAMITDRRMTYNGFLIGLYHGSSLDTSQDEQDDDTVSFRLKLESKCSLNLTYACLFLRLFHIPYEVFLLTELQFIAFNF